MNRLLSVLGLVGLVVCAVGIAGVWVVEQRVNRAADYVFERTDQVLSMADLRLIEIRSAVENSKLTLADVTEEVKEWAADGARERVVDRLKVESRVASVEARLDKAELLLDASADSLQDVQRLLGLAADLGLPVSGDYLADARESLEGFRDQLVAAGTTLENLSNRLRDDESENRRERVLEFTGQLVATFSQLDTRLATLSQRLDGLQQGVARLRSTTSRRLVTVAVVATLVLLWVAAGQLALWRRGAA